MLACRADVLVPQVGLDVGQVTPCLRDTDTHGVTKVVRSDTLRPPCSSDGANERSRQKNPQASASTNNSHAAIMSSFR